MPRQSCRRDSSLMRDPPADDRARNVLQVVPHLHERPARATSCTSDCDAVILTAAELHDQPAAWRQLRGRTLEHAAHARRARPRRQTPPLLARSRALPASAPGFEPRARTADWRRSRRRLPRCRRRKLVSTNVMRSSTPCRAALRRATAERARRHVGGDQRARRESPGRATMAMQPLPVPTSTMRGQPSCPTSASVSSTMHLRLVAGDQHVGAHFEVEAPELPRAQDVGHRLAPFAARDERLVVQQEDARRLLVAVGEKTRAIPAEHLAREHLGVERREAGADPGVHEAIARALDEIVNASSCRGRRFLELLGLVVRRRRCPAARRGRRRSAPRRAGAS